MNENSERAVRNCQQLFGYDRVVIFSNSAGGRYGGDSQAGSEDDRGYLHAEAIEEEMGVKVIRHRQKKPEGLMEAICAWDAVQPSEVMMVGDRYLTDIYGGNLLGMLTVAVDIFTEVNDNKGGDSGPARGARAAEAGAPACRTDRCSSPLPRSTWNLCSDVFPSNTSNTTREK